MNRNYNNYLSNSWTNVNAASQNLDARYLFGSYEDLNSFYTRQLQYNLLHNPVPKKIYPQPKYKVSGPNNSYLETYTNEAFRNNLADQRNYEPTYNYTNSNPRRQAVRNLDTEHDNSDYYSYYKPNINQFKPNEKNSEIIKMYQESHQLKTSRFPNNDSILSADSSIKSSDSIEIKRNVRTPFKDTNVALNPIGRSNEYLRSFANNNKKDNGLRQTF
jgi:hypothetical protein